jgi:cytochrome bd ubiquinol oxidase subunit I
VYGVLLASYLYFVLALVRRGPALPTDHPEAIRGARPGELLPANPQDVVHDGARA